MRSLLSKIIKYIDEYYTHKATEQMKNRNWV